MSSLTPILPATQPFVPPPPPPPPSAAVAAAAAAVRARSSPHICELCGYAATFASDLRKHMFTHSKEKPNRCQICNKGFACDSNRKKHELVHLDTKSFKCKVPGCNEGFNYYTSLQMHVQSVHCDEKFGCSLCAKRYSSKPNVFKHIRNKHKGEPGAAPVLIRPLGAMSSNTVFRRISHKRVVAPQAAPMQAPVGSGVLEHSLVFAAAVAAAAHAVKLGEPPF